MDALFIFLAVLVLAGVGIWLFRRARKPQGYIRPGRPSSPIDPRQED